MEGVYGAEATDVDDRKDNAMATLENGIHFQDCILVVVAAGAGTVSIYCVFISPLGFSIRQECFRGSAYTFV